LSRYYFVFLKLARIIHVLANEKGPIIYQQIIDPKTLWPIDSFNL